MMVIAAKTEEDIAEPESYEDKQLFLEELGLGRVASTASSRKLTPC